MKKIKTKPIIFFYLIIILYYVFCWYNYRILENGKENNYLLNMQYNECEKYIKVGSETQKEIYEKYKDKFIVDENCKDLVIEGEKPNSIYSIYQGFLSSEKFIIPFFMPLLVLIPFMYALSKEYNGKIVKQFCLRSKYSNYIKHIYKKAYKNIYIIPLFIVITLIICFLISKGNLNPVVDENLNFLLPNISLLKPNLLSLFFFLLVITLNAGIYINIGLFILNHNKKFIISLIESVICIFLVWALSEIIIGLMFNNLLNINSGNFNILNIYDWAGVTNKYIYLSYNFILFVITGLISYLSYKNKEKFIIMCEK